MMKEMYRFFRDFDFSPTLIICMPGLIIYFFLFG